MFVELPLQTRNRDVYDLSEALCPHGELSEVRKKVEHYARAIKINQNLNLLY